MPAKINDNTTMTNKAEEVSYLALRQMYSEAEPPLEFFDALANPDEYNHKWWEDHYLDSDRQKEIVEEYCEKYDLNEGQCSTVHWTAILNFGPTGVKDDDSNDRGHAQIYETPDKDPRD